jgi:toxin-antitoxin system PIN domain toxin
VTSCDTNVLFAACDADNPRHAQAHAFLKAHAADGRFVLAEQVLLELYTLLRNPVVTRPALGAEDAAAFVEGFRSNPHWRIVDVPADGTVMGKLWRIAAQPGFPYRRIFDVRLGLTLRHHGVTQFATRNAHDFAGLDFARVWDP